MAKELKSPNFGIIWVTPENLNSAWILFEAGALAKSLQGAKVIPCCSVWSSATSAAAGAVPGQEAGQGRAFRDRAVDQLVGCGARAGGARQAAHCGPMADDREDDRSHPGRGIW